MSMTVDVALNDMAFPEEMPPSLQFNPRSRDRVRFSRNKKGNPRFRGLPFGALCIG